MVYKSLPIFQYREEILKTIERNQVTIITAETGAGKSTQVPQFLFEEGKKVIVTQPRKIATYSLAERVADEQGVRVGNEIGYHTADEKRSNRDTKVLFCTDGLQLVRELTSKQEVDVLILDEVHEWNLNIETLIAWSKQQIKKGWNTKLILMSATLDAEKLSKYFDNAPVISVPGRLYPVTVTEVDEYSLISSIKELVEQKRNVLVFQPGKKEIAQTIADLAGIEAKVFPLHSEVTQAEQRACFKIYDIPKVIVATNIAQTSITIADIDAVIDSGKERRQELSDGIEGLYLKDTSQADCKQRQGRAGRTKDGIYVLCSNTKIEDRQEYPLPEIKRSRLDQTVLRLKNANIDATELEFFHQPDHKELERAKKSLFALGAFSKDGKITKTGKLMARFPLNVQFARMIIEAQKLDVLQDTITIAAILEVGGINDRTDKWKMLSQEKESDLLVQLDIWKQAIKLKPYELRDYGIFKKSYMKAKERRRKIVQALGSISLKSKTDREKTKKACVAGLVEHLYEYDYGDYSKEGDVDRDLDKNSCIESAKWIVGIPKDIQFQGRHGLLTKNLINLATKVDVDWLMDVAPQLIKTEKGLYPTYDGDKDVVISTTKVSFNDKEIKKVRIDDPSHPESNYTFCTWLADKIIG